ncbi:MAG TPA: putative molybdenum carrier protein, partial [Haloferula sp.]
VKRSDGTVVFTMAGLTGGSARTMDFARRHRRPHLHLALRDVLDDLVERSLRDFVAEHSLRVLNVAGSSVSSEPEIYERVFKVMCRLLSKGGDARGLVV